MADGGVADGRHPVHFDPPIHVVLRAERPSVALGSLLTCKITFRLPKGLGPVAYELDYSQAGWMVAGETAGTVGDAKNDCSVVVVEQTLNLIPLRRGELALPMVQLPTIPANRLTSHSLPPIISVSAPRDVIDARTNETATVPANLSVTFCVP